MTVRALLGLAAFNVFVLGVGSAWLWALRGWGSLVELLRDAGLGYMLGVAVVGIALSVELALGVPFSFASVSLTGAGLAFTALALRRPLARWRPAPSPFPRPGIGLVGAAFGLLIVVYLEALFRAGRLAPLSAWDAWAFWVPKAKAIYFFEGLDEQFFRELANPTYPPLLPALEASAFHFMGSPDVVTLHVQFWVFTFGFVAAIASLLGPRVHAALLGPFLLLVLVAPRVMGRTLEPQADFLLDYLFALAVLLVALWLVDREPWLLAAASAFMAAALLTKREGLLLTACMLVAAFAASWRFRRYAWPRVAIAGIAAVAVSIPWRWWFTSRDLTGELPSAGPLPLSESPSRGWPAFEAAITTIFDYDLWLVAVPLVGVGVVLAYAAGARVLPTYALALYALLIAGVTWVLWSFTELELSFVQDEGVSPTIRLAGAVVVVSAAIIPLLLDAAWHGTDRSSSERP